MASMFALAYALVSSLWGLLRDETSPWYVLLFQSVIFGIGMTAFEFGFSRWRHGRVSASRGRDDASPPPA